MKVALITGITGQVGSYLAEYLLDKGYVVHGIVRRTSNFTTGRIDHIFSKLTLHYGDITDLASVINVIKNVNPDELYNLAAQSHVKVSDSLEKYTMDTNAMGVLNILQAIRLVNPKIKLVQASTSEMFGNTISDKLNEKSEMKPVSVYGISKLAGYNLVRYYREAYDMFACNSVSFNHESPRRGKTFVTRKIAEYTKKYNRVLDLPPLLLGNLDARRDWSHTLDIVNGMWMMLQAGTPDDYTLGSGVSYSVRDFVNESFGVCGVELKWCGSGLTEYAMDKRTRRVVVKVDPKYFRSVDISNLVCDNTYVKEKLGWESKITFKELVKCMNE